MEKLTMNPRTLMRKCERAVISVLITLVAALVPHVVLADSLEYAVKAAYLYKLGEFVEWPASAFASPDSPVNLCIVGDDPFDGILDKTVQGQHIGSHSIVVRRLKSITRESGCQIVYAGTSDAQQASRWLESTRGAQILTVTDSLPSTAGGGIVNFIIKDNHVRFEIDNQSAVANGLVISSKLLALAQPTAP